MQRLQIQLTQEQASSLRHMAAQYGVSVAELVRRAVEDSIKRSAEQSREAIVERALRAVGRFSSGRSDVSTQHDKELGEAFRS